VIWLTWRQFRVNVAVVGAGLLALAVALASTGPHLAAVYEESASTFLTWLSIQSADQDVYTIGMAAGYVVPAVIGAFWGAPMIARELESGTHRLIWTQSVTRSRWLAAKLGLGMLGAVAAAGVIGLGTTWWAHPVDRAVTGTGSDSGSIFTVARISPEMFASRGVAPIGYAALAFALGVLAGALIRRTVPAMAVTLVVYVFLQIAMPLWVRPHLVSPAVQTTPITAETLNGIRGRGPDGPVDGLVVTFDKPGAWVTSNRTVDGNGKAVRTFPDWVTTCLPVPGTQEATVGAREQACFDRLTSLGYAQRATFQPAGHYWALQWRETGLLLGGAALLSGACFWRVRRLS